MSELPRWADLCAPGPLDDDECETTCGACHRWTCTCDDDEEGES